MPRAESSQATRIVTFFRTAPLEVAALVMDLSKDALRERQQKSRDAKARQAGTVTPAKTEAAAAPTPKKKAAPKKKAKKRTGKPAAPATPAHDTTPFPPGPPASEVDGEAGMSRVGQ